MATTADNHSDLIPPQQLIEANAIGDGDFREIGEGMISGLIGRGLITPTSKILDIGCGLGRLARPLVDYLNGGSYFGIDINQSSIDWCKQNYTRHANFRFEWLDAYSKFYNPNGRLMAEKYRFPFPDQDFDLVMLTSVFTHMMMRGVDNYLSEIARILKTGGRCYATYFLLNKKFNRDFSSQRQFFPIEGGFVADKDSPEKVVFLRRDRVTDLYRKHRLKICHSAFGSWSGDKSAGGYQDEIVAEKLPAAKGIQRITNYLGNFWRG